MSDLTLNEYQARALRTAGPLDNDDERIICAALGLSGESGEYADRIKKAIFHSHPRDRAKEALEIGDVLWYASLAAKAAGFTLEEVAQMNLDKLARRYPEGFSSERSLNREVPP